jgi:hypothetical protein
MPPKTPAPTEQPRQPAFAGAGAAKDARPTLAAAAAATSDLCICSPDDRSGADHERD